MECNALPRQLITSADNTPKETKNNTVISFRLALLMALA